MTDYISRADAIDAVCDGCVWYKTASCEVGKEEWECSEVNKIRHLPSADAVHGEWINEWKDIDGGRMYGACCSVCHAIGHSGYNYCPNCGARMKGGDSE